jgi:hypothetical protein
MELDILDINIAQFDYSRVLEGIESIYALKTTISSMQNHNFSKNYVIGFQ